MLHNIPPKVLQRMKLLEQHDKTDRVDGTPRLNRLRQVDNETGELLAILLSSSPEGIAVEIGTSAGYSALWLSLGCRVKNRKLYTFELLPEKIALARETFAAAGVEDIITLVEGDAVINLQSLANISFAFIDTEKELYHTCYEILLPRMVKGGLLAADNVESHGDILSTFLSFVKEDARVDSSIIPIGKGLLLCRKV